MQFEMPNYNFKNFIRSKIIRLAAIVPCTGIDCDVCDLYTGVSNIINFLLWTAVLPLLVISLLAAGVFFLISGSSEKYRTMAKDILWYAIIGTLTAFTAWVIVNTILDTLGYKISAGGNTFLTWNDTRICKQYDKLKQTPKAQSGPVTPGAGEAGGVQTPTGNGTLPTGTLSNADALSRLQANNIRVVSSGSCSNQNNPTCTSLQGIPASTIDELIRINNEMKALSGNSDLVITGGTEVGHQTHGTGKSIVDIDDTAGANIYFFGRIGTTNPKNNTWYQDKSNNNRYYYYEGDHWHACLNTLACPQAVGTD